MYLGGSLSRVKIKFITYLLVVSVVDASGRYESGLFKGNRYWLGSKAECLQLVSALSLFNLT